MHSGRRPYGAGAVGGDEALLDRALVGVREDAEHLDGAREVLLLDRVEQNCVHAQFAGAIALLLDGGGGGRSGGGGGAEAERGRDRGRGARTENVSALHVVCSLGR